MFTDFALQRLDSVDGGTHKEEARKAQIHCSIFTNFRHRRMVNDRQHKKRKETEAVVIMVEDIVRTQQQDLLTMLNMVRTMISSQNKGWGGRAAIGYSLNSKVPAQVKHMDRLFGITDTDCISNLRMDRNAFGR